MPNERIPPPDRTAGARWDPGSPAATATAPREEAAAGPRHPIVRYVGFRCTDSGREYTMRVSEGLSSRRFVLLITHQAFASREVRFQDAPDVCSAKLRRALAADPDLLASESMALTAQDLLDYRVAHNPPSPSSRRARPKP